MGGYNRPTSASNTMMTPNNDNLTTLRYLSKVACRINVVPAAIVDEEENPGISPKPFSICLCIF